jgi:hypothetical protein
MDYKRYSGWYQMAEIKEATSCEVMQAEALSFYGRKFWSGELVDPVALGR